MTTRQPARKGPIYEMKPFAGSRQPAGPSPLALAKLQESGHIVGEPAPGLPESTPVPPVATSPPAATPAASDPAPASPPSHTSDAPTATDSATTSPPSRASSKRSTRGTSARGASERKARRNNKYDLPQPDTTKGKSRSNHFRLPPDVEEFLEELATAHDCSRTRVVCSAIASEWQRLKRRQGRAVKPTPT